MSFADLVSTESPSQRRAKIVATLGPASNTEPVIREMIQAGVDVVRLNFSHSTHERKVAVIQKIRKVSKEEHKPLCILADLQGPKIRTTLLKDHQPVLLKAGPPAHHHAARSARAQRLWSAPHSKRSLKTLSKARAFCFPTASSSFACTRFPAKTWSATSSTAACWAKARASIFPAFWCARPRSLRRTRWIWSSR